MANLIERIAFEISDIFDIILLYLNNGEFITLFNTYKFLEKKSSDINFWKRIYKLKFGILPIDISIEKLKQSYLDKSIQRKLYYAIPNRPITTDYISAFKYWMTITSGNIFIDTLIKKNDFDILCFYFTNTPYISDELLEKLWIYDSRKSIEQLLIYLPQIAIARILLNTSLHVIIQLPRTKSIDNLELVEFWVTCKSYDNQKIDYTKAISAAYEYNSPKVLNYLLDKLPKIEVLHLCLLSNLYDIFESYNFDDIDITNFISYNFYDLICPRYNISPIGMDILYLFYTRYYDNFIESFIIWISTKNIRKIDGIYERLRIFDNMDEIRFIILRGLIDSTTGKSKRNYKIIGKIVNDIEDVDELINIYNSSLKTGDRICLKFVRERLFNKFKNELIEI